MLLYLTEAFPKGFSNSNVNISKFKGSKYSVTNNSLGFVNNYMIGHYSMLVNNKIRLTVRKTKIKENPSKIFKVLNKSPKKSKELNFFL